MVKSVTASPTRFPVSTFTLHPGGFGNCFRHNQRVRPTRELRIPHFVL